jgi:HEAT repeat protein
MGGKAVQPLINELSSKKHRVRWEAAKALGQIGDAAAAGHGITG